MIGDCVGGSLRVPRHRPQHGNQGAVGVLAVAQGVVKGHLDGLAIDLQTHGIWTHCQHPGCLGRGQACVMVGIGQDGFGMVVVHVGADSLAHGGGDGVSGHSK